MEAMNLLSRCMHAVRHLKLISTEKIGKPEQSPSELRTTLETILNAFQFCSSSTGQFAQYLMFI